MTSTYKFSTLRRLGLDTRIDSIRKILPNLRPPRDGWVRTIRTALGMTMAQLGRRAHISQPSVLRIEKAEPSGRVQLDTLIRIADALDCDFVYALVPRQPINEIVNERLTNLAERRYSRTAHTMALENQLDEISRKIRDAKIESIRGRIGPTEIWKDDA